MLAHTITWMAWHIGVIVALVAVLWVVALHAMTK